MLEKMIRAVINKMIAADYPHLKLPTVVFAKVDSAKKMGETFQVEELAIYNDETGTILPCHHEPLSVRWRLSVSGPESVDGYIPTFCAIHLPPMRFMGGWISL